MNLRIFCNEEAEIPLVVVTANGCFLFSEFFANKYKEANNLWIELYFDAENNKIVFRFCKEKTKYSIRVSFKYVAENNCDIFHPYFTNLDFLKLCKIQLNDKQQFICEERDGLWFIDLNTQADIFTSCVELTKERR